MWWRKEERNCCVLSKVHLQNKVCYILPWLFTISKKYFWMIWREINVIKTAKGMHFLGRSCSRTGVKLKDDLKVGFTLYQHKAFIEVWDSRTNYHITSNYRKCDDTCKAAKLKSGLYLSNVCTPAKKYMFKNGICFCFSFFPLKRYDR